MKKKRDKSKMFLSANKKTKSLKSTFPFFFFLIRTVRLPYVDDQNQETYFSDDKIPLCLSIVIIAIYYILRTKISLFFCCFFLLLLLFLKSETHVHKKRDKNGEQVRTFQYGMVLVLKFEALS